MNEDNNIQDPQVVPDVTGEPDLVSPQTVSELVGAVAQAQPQPVTQPEVITPAEPVMATPIETSAVVTPLAGLSKPVVAPVDAFAQAPDYSLPPIDPQPQPEVEAKNNDPKPKKQRGGWGVRTLMIIIAVQFLVIIGLTAFSLNILTNGPVQVVLNSNSPQTNQDLPANQNTDVTPNDSETTDNTDTSQDVPTVTTATYYELYSSGLHGDKELPENSVPFLNEQTGDYFVPIIFSLDAGSTMEPVGQAMAKLFEGKSSSNVETGFSTTLHLSTITVEFKKTSDGRDEVNLVGDLIAEGDISSGYMKGQIESTLDFYLDDYLILLNGSAEDYTNFGSLEG